MNAACAAPCRTAQAITVLQCCKSAAVWRSQAPVCLPCQAQGRMLTERQAVEQATQVSAAGAVPDAAWQGVLPAAAVDAQPATHLTRVHADNLLREQVICCCPCVAQASSLRVSCSVTRCIPRLLLHLAGPEQSACPYQAMVMFQIVHLDAPDHPC